MSSNQYTSTSDTRDGAGNAYSTHSVVPLRGQKLKAVFDSSREDAASAWSLRARAPRPAETVTVLREASVGNGCGRARASSRGSQTIISPCPRGWRSEGASSIELAREAVNTCYWPLFEVENGVYHLTYRPLRKEPVTPWLKKQGRFGHLFKAGNESVLHALEEWVDGEWDELLVKCGEPTEAAWRAQREEHVCLR